MKLYHKQVQLERLRSENTSALSPMNKFKNIIQVTPWLILENDAAVSLYIYAIIDDSYKFCSHFIDAYLQLTTSVCVLITK